MTTDRAPPDVIQMLNRVTAAVAEATEPLFLMAMLITRKPPSADAIAVAMIADAETLLGRYEDAWDDPDLHAACARLGHVIGVAKRVFGLDAELDAGRPTWG